MKININPAGYLVMDEHGNPDCATIYKVSADNAAKSFDGHARVEPLHPESLVIEMAEALAAMDEAYCNAGSDMSREERHAGRVALIKARALFARVVVGSAS